MTGLLGYVMHPQSTPTLLHKSPIVCNQMSLAVYSYTYMANFQKYEKQSYNGVISMEISIKCYDMYTAKDI